MTNPQDEYIESEDLLFSSAYGIRILYLRDTPKEGIIGVAIEETEDSLLMGMPVSIVTKSSIIGPADVGFLPPYVRMFKSAVSMMVMAQGPLETAYIKYLRSYAEEVFPELLEMLGESPEPHSADHEVVEPEEQKIDKTSGEVMAEAVKEITKGSEELILEAQSRGAILVISPHRIN